MWSYIWNSNLNSVYDSLFYLIGLLYQAGGKKGRIYGDLESGEILITQSKGISFHAIYVKKIHQTYPQNSSKYMLKP